MISSPFSLINLVVCVSGLSFLGIAQIPDVSFAQDEVDLGSFFLVSEKSFGEAVKPSDSSIPFSGVWNCVSTKETEGIMPDGIFPDDEEGLDEVYLVKVVDDHLFVGNVEWQHEAFALSNHRLTLRNVGDDQLLFADIAEDRFFFALCEQLENGNLRIFLPDTRKVAQIAKREFESNLPIDEDLECLVMDKKLVELIQTLPHEKVYEDSPTLELRRMLPEPAKKK